jgi:hypothetical protein
LRHPPRAGDVEPGPSHQWTGAGAGHALDSVLMSDDLPPRLPKDQPQLLKFRGDSDVSSVPDFLFNLDPYVIFSDFGRVLLCEKLEIKSHSFVLSASYGA